MEPQKADFIFKHKDLCWNVTKTCEAVNISRSTYYHWLKTDPEFRQFIDDCTESYLDLAESTLVRAMNDGDTDSSKFLLKHKGKKRGYTETQNVDLTSGGLPFQLNVIVKSEEDKKKLENI